MERKWNVAALIDLMGRGFKGVTFAPKVGYNSVKKINAGPYQGKSLIQSSTGL